MFFDSIAQLLHNFPVDQVDTHGQPFWSGTKRAPSPVVFDAADPTHLAFVAAAANLRAKNFGLRGRRAASDEDRAWFRKVLADVIVPDFVPRDGVRIARDDEELKAQSAAGPSSSAGDVDAEARAVAAKLPDPGTLAGFRLEPAEFEKDDDANGHMDFITACANLRARNYRIGEVDRHRAKQVAGKIIPAIATTTALVTGLVSLEMYKLLCAEPKPIEAFRNAFVNLALPLFALSEPLPPAANEYDLNGKKHRFTVWDRVDLKGPLTLAQFIAQFDERFGVEVQMISYGTAILYSFFASPKKIKKRMPMLMEDLGPSVAKTELGDRERFMVFEVCCTDKDDEDVDLPQIRYEIVR
jgi:ubiquitin-activating enzyme E1